MSEGPTISSPEHSSRSELALRSIPLSPANLPRWLVLGLIRVYQTTLARALPPDTCRFHPTCSHYGYQAIYRFGVIRGGWLTLWRLLRCNPFNPGGYDPVPLDPRPPASQTEPT